jgi:hypothetical protein
MLMFCLSIFPRRRIDAPVCGRAAALAWAWPTPMDINKAKKTVNARERVFIFSVLKKGSVFGAKSR